MSEILSVNQLIQWRDGSDNPLTERILWIDESNIIAYVIDIFSKEAFPKLRKISEIQEEFVSGDLIVIKNDPMFKLLLEEEIKESSLKIRDKAWQIVSKISSSKFEPEIYERDGRGNFVKKAIQEYGVTNKTVYKYLRKYWQRGKHKNALLPDYANSGGKGKEKKLGDKKVGRPRKNLEAIGEGINVEEETKKIFRLALSKYYYTYKQNNLTMAYDLMVKEFFVEDYIYENGIWKPILLPINQIPTFTQFKYWYKKEENIKNTIVRRKGSKKFELLHRSILGKSDTDVVGPGSTYQIDATIGDIYLISRYNKRWIIGRPVIYAIIDVFSRMVTGIYVGLEGPSWLGAMMALANASIDKVKFCSEYGIDITSEEWPCFHLPEAILADRGEMEGTLVETYINNLQVRIDNTPPYRADWKGIIEQYFHTINEHVKPLLPGVVLPDFRERGGKDYRLDAKLDIYEFTRIIIMRALYHNNEHRLKNYDRNVDMISDEVELIPREMWNWGIKNRSGRLRTFPEDIIKLNLMPSEKARVTEKGIKFKKCLYACETAIKEQWFENARNKGSWEIHVSYDPRNMNYLYIRNDTGRAFEECFLLASQERYKDKTLDEIIYLLESEKLYSKLNEGKVLQAKANLITEIEAIVNSAEKAAKDIKTGYGSKASRLRNIKQNRREEKESIRENEAFVLGENKEKVAEGKLININRAGSEKNANENLEDIELLKKMQRERLNARRNK